VFGRTGSRVSVAAAGKRVRRGSRCAPQGYDVLFKERNGRYISPDEFAGNQRLIADRMGIGAVKGAVRRGELLLAGFLRCGHCGRKLDVLYSGLGRGQTMAGFKRHASLTRGRKDRSVDNPASFAHARGPKNGR
jgi:hypothetical protein